MKLYELLQISYDRSLDPSIIIIHVIPYKNLAKNHPFLAVSLTSFIYNVQPSPIFLSACTITRFLWFERGVGGQASQYRPLSPVICEKCSKRYPRNKFPRNFPSYSSGKSLRSFDLSSLLPISPFPLRLSSSLGASKERQRTRELGRKETARRDDRGRAGGYNFISRHETNERALRDAPVGRQICSSLLFLPVFEIT